MTTHLSLPVGASATGWGKRLPALTQARAGWRAEPLTLSSSGEGRCPALGGPRGGQPCGGPQERGSRRARRGPQSDLLRPQHHAPGSPHTLTTSAGPHTPRSPTAPGILLPATCPSAACAGAEGMSLAPWEAGPEMQVRESQRLRREVEGIARETGREGSMELCATVGHQLLPGVPWSPVESSA